MYFSKEVFSKRRQQKRAKIGATDLEGFLEAANKKAEGYNNGSDRRALVDAAGQERAEEAEGHVGEEIFNKGTSRRIWAELYKANRNSITYTQQTAKVLLMPQVVDAADVLVFVLDARDPMGTRCQQLESPPAEFQQSCTH